MTGDIFISSETFDLRFFNHFFQISFFNLFLGTEFCMSIFQAKMKIDIFVFLNFEHID